MKERKIISQDKTKFLSSLDPSALAIRIQLLEYDLSVCKEMSKKFKEIKSIWNSHETDEKEVIKYIEKIING